MIVQIIAQLQEQLFAEVLTPIKLSKQIDCRNQHGLVPSEGLRSLPREHASQDDIDNARFQDERIVLVDGADQGEDVREVRLGRAVLVQEVLQLDGEDSGKIKVFHQLLIDFDKVLLEQMKHELGQLEDLVHVGEDGLFRVDENVQQEVLEEQQDVQLDLAIGSQISLNQKCNYVKWQFIRIETAHEEVLLRSVRNAVVLRTFPVHKINLLQQIQQTLLAVQSPRLQLQNYFAQRRKHRGEGFLPLFFPSGRLHVNPNVVKDPLDRVLLLVLLEAIFQKRQVISQRNPQNRPVAQIIKLVEILVLYVERYRQEALQQHPRLNDTLPLPQLVKDLPQPWNHPRRKRIRRTRKGQKLVHQSPPPIEPSRVLLGQLLRVPAQPVQKVLENDLVLGHVVEAARLPQLNSVRQVGVEVLVRNCEAFEDFFFHCHFWIDFTLFNNLKLLKTTRNEREKTP
uniref:(northern house mosquito) hypothetical protein n=1 Tax=Culex pipiens TaxID=7175 RepID=A0A8D8KSQ9_CULPI